VRRLCRGLEASLSFPEQCGVTVVVGIAQQLVLLLLAFHKVAQILDVRMPGLLQVVVVQLLVEVGEELALLCIVNEGIMVLALLDACLRQKVSQFLAR
jgi:hypothetical protein